MKFYCSDGKFKKYISICRQAHYLTQRFLLTGRPWVWIRSFSAMSIHSIDPILILWEYDACTDACMMHAPRMHAPEVLFHLIVKKTYFNQFKYELLNV